ncbi:hypothetical protein N7539_003405, partial [Penicillium diatomitis]
ASLSQVKDGSWIRLFQLDVARSLAAQLVLVVNYLNGNPLPPGVLSHSVASIWLGQASEKITLTEARILLSDFGKAFLYLNKQKYESRTPLLSVRPRLGLNQISLCLSHRISGLSPTLYVLSSLSSHYSKRKWEARRYSFSEDSMPMNLNPFRSWDDRFEDSMQQPRRDNGMPLFDARDRDAIFDMLRPMLSFRPESRPTTQQILESEWMVKWALPEYSKINNDM